MNVSQMFNQKPMKVQNTVKGTFVVHVAKGLMVENENGSADRPFSSFEAALSKLPNAASYGENITSLPIIRVLTGAFSGINIDRPCLIMGEGVVTFSGTSAAAMVAFRDIDIISLTATGVVAAKGCSLAGVVTGHAALDNCSGALEVTGSALVTNCVMDSLSLGGGNIYNSTIASLVGSDNAVEVTNSHVAASSGNVSIVGALDSVPTLESSVATITIDGPVDLDTLTINGEEITFVEWNIDRNTMLVDADKLAAMLDEVEGVTATADDTDVLVVAEDFLFTSNDIPVVNSALVALDTVLAEDEFLVNDLTYTFVTSLVGENELPLTTPEDIVDGLEDLEADITGTVVTLHHLSGSYLGLTSSDFTVTDSCTIALDTVVPTDTITFGLDTEITFVAVDPGPAEVLIGADNAATATNLATLLNGVEGISASAEGAVVTVTGTYANSDDVTFIIVSYTSFDFADIEAGDEITGGAITWTFVAVDPYAVLKGATDAESAANLATAINQSTLLDATSEDNAFTLTGDITSMSASATFLIMYRTTLSLADAVPGDVLTFAEVDREFVAELVPDPGEVVIDENTAANLAAYLAPMSIVVEDDTLTLTASGYRLYITSQQGFSIKLDLEERNPLGDVIYCYTAPAGAVDLHVGDAVALTAAYAVTNALSAEDPIFGQALDASEENNVPVRVRARGIVRFGYTGSAPQLNIGIVASDSAGAVKAPETGSGCGKVVKIDTTARTVDVIL